MRNPLTTVITRGLPVVAAGLALVVAQAGTAAACPVVGVAHRVTTSPDGREFHLDLIAGPTTLPVAGGTVQVAGSGYNEDQGIFLAFCAVKDGVKVGDPSTYTTLPTPCLGGRESTDGSARRITNSATGTPGVTIPYGPHGSFRTTLNLTPHLPDGTTCDVDVQCAIVTRADYTATDDRTYDQYIAVHFHG
ncbi:hypothetical protein [Kutzneria buriramensis]|uniref:Uncharacterized protein n=1 Tax=Kutzneria buriramensis TaxID=1045776 RepID=A0A3E0GUV9_9PSEU|nr:hypothetical protein [Kutzneria buriramensis]REH26948.1 hypothetical protein BCF44_1313 [Kutzneria buriramensis]